MVRKIANKILDKGLRGNLKELLFEIKCSVATFITSLGKKTIEKVFKG